MNREQLQFLKVLFWGALGLVVIGLVGSVTDRVIRTKNATRTESSTAAPIAVPAETGTSR